jgi:hypothetical protein
VTSRTPGEFGFFRSRWTCATVVVLLQEDHGVQVSRETVRRWLHAQDLVWRRPRPVLGPRHPQRPAKLRKIRALLRHLHADEIAVFQDEVDINTNPEIGSMWMRKGQQAEVVTPGQNSKRYLAGSLNWGTGQLLLTQGQKRNADLFLAHLDELRRRWRHYRRIHVICDNAIFHHPERCRKVRDYLAQGDTASSLLFFDWHCAFSGSQRDTLVDQVPLPRRFRNHFAPNCPIVQNRHGHGFLPFASGEKRQPITCGNGRIRWFSFTLSALGIITSQPRRLSFAEKTAIALAALIHRWGSLYLPTQTCSSSGMRK